MSRKGHKDPWRPIIRVSSNRLACLIPLLGPFVWCQNWIRQRVPNYNWYGLEGNLILSWLIFFFPIEVVYQKFYLYYVGGFVFGNLLRLFPTFHRRNVFLLLLKGVIYFSSTVPLMRIFFSNLSSEKLYEFLTLHLFFKH